VLLNKKPRVRSVAHTKRNELAGKKRAIYGVDFDSYIVGAYAADGFEETLCGAPLDLRHTGGAELDDFMKVADLGRAGNWLLSFDYADFNAQHSTAAMQAVYSARIARVLSSVAPSQARDDTVAALAWLSESLTDVEVSAPGQPWLKTSGGLLSGMRDTTSLNSLLNYAYCQLVADELRELGARQSAQPKLRAAFYAAADPSFWRVHGDDVIAAFPSALAARLWRDTALSLGLVANPAKCLIWQGSGEYLRRWFSPDGVVRGSAARALGSWTCGNWDQPGLTQAPVLAQVAAQAHTLMRRGISGLAAVTVAIHAAASFDDSAAGDLALATSLLSDTTATMGQPLPRALLAPALFNLKVFGCGRHTGPRPTGLSAQALRQVIRTGLRSGQLGHHAASDWVHALAADVGVTPAPDAAQRISAGTRIAATDTWERLANSVPEGPQAHPPITPVTPVGATASSIAPAVLAHAALIRLRPMMTRFQKTRRSLFKRGRASGTLVRVVSALRPDWSERQVRSRLLALGYELLDEQQLRDSWPDNPPGMMAVATEQWALGGCNPDVVPGTGVVCLA